LRELLDHLSRIQKAPWGRLLDAGTGRSSLGWALSLPGAEVTAVTADPQRHESLSPLVTAPHRLLLGNWQQTEFLRGEEFDTVVADDLLGACERYAPYFQEELLQRLCQVCIGNLWILGRQPWPNQAHDGNPLYELVALRDAVQILLGRRPHRELPLAWLTRQINPHYVQLFPCVYEQDFAERELAALRLNLDQLNDNGLAQVLRRCCHKLEKQLQQVAHCIEGQVYLVGWSREPNSTG
jgi:hypothetical protein